jgi:hypothetical protein
VTRDEAIAYGRRLGEHEVERRLASGRTLSGDDQIDIVKRAMYYAAWEWDGKPTGRAPEYRKEFGLA